MFKFSICCCQIVIGGNDTCTSEIPRGGEWGEPTEICMFVPLDVKTQSEEAGVVGQDVCSNKADTHVQKLASITYQKAACTSAERIWYEIV